MLTQMGNRHRSPWLCSHLQLPAAAVQLLFITSQVESVYGSKKNHFCVQDSVQRLDVKG